MLLLGQGSISRKVNRVRSCHRYYVSIRNEINPNQIGNLDLDNCAVSFLFLEVESDAQKKMHHNSCFVKQYYMLP